MAEPKPYHWWTASKEDVGWQVVSSAMYLQRNQANRLQALDSLESLYRAQMSWLSPGMSALVDPIFATRVSLNVIASCVDTATSEISANRISPFVLSDGGDWQTRRRAKKLTQWSRGIRYAQRGHEICTDAVRDGLMYGTGLTKVCNSGKKVTLERIDPRNFFVDEVETRWGPPSQLFEVRLASRAKILAQYGKDEGEDKEAIERANKESTTNPGRWVQAITVSDNIRVWEAHYLAPDEDTPGRHVIVLESGEVLLDEEYEYEVGPYVAWHYSPPAHGFWGTGMIELLRDAQLAINVICIALSQSAYGSMKSITYVPEECGINLEAYNNNPRGGAIKVAGTVFPQHVTPAPISPEYVNLLMMWVNYAYQISGVSQMRAAAQKPTGITSGLALQTYSDEVDKRFAQFQTQVEQGYCDVANLNIRTARDIAKEGRGGYEVRSPGSRFVKSVNLKDAILKDDEFVIRTWPVNQLEQTPAARRQQAQEYIQAGIIPVRDALEVFGMPDIDSFANQEYADIERIEWVLDRICDEQIYDSACVPDHNDNLPMIVQMTRSMINVARSSGAPPEVVGLLEQYQEAAMTLLQESQQPTAAPGAPALPPGGPPAAPGVPQAHPAQAPTSPLLPQA